MQTITDILQRHAIGQPDKPALIFLGDDNVEEDRLTYGALYAAALQNAAHLAGMAKPGARVGLSFETSSDFARAFFGCLYAGLVPVPIPSVSGRRHRHTVESILANCGADLILSASPKATADSALLGSKGPKAASVLRQTTDDASPADAIRPAGLSEIAYLQYTSGSTSAPKGVIVSHENLVTNLAMMTKAFETGGAASLVGWAPLYHDMGLVANFLHPLSLGATSILMTPRQFAAKPWLWLKAVSDYRAAVSGGPNFAYDLCLRRARHILRLDLDLSNWRIAFNSAEPVRKTTIERFAATFAEKGFHYSAFYPCYGMAEATLLVAGGHPSAPPKYKDEAPGSASNAADTVRDLVGCGRHLEGETICIVGPDGKELPDNQIGEIWVAGPNIPTGYWQNPEASAETFSSTLETRSGLRFLRTGDLAFTDQGELYFAGRIKDVLIIRGKNFYPQDIEYVAETTGEALRQNSNAVFATRDGDGGEYGVVCVQEVERQARHQMDIADCKRRIRQAVFEEFEISLAYIALVKPGQIPKTSSGKVRRSAARQMYLDGAFQELTDMPSQQSSIRDTHVAGAS